MDPRRGGDCDPRGSAHHHGDACSLAVPCISAHPRDPCGPARRRSPASSAPSHAPTSAGTQPRGPLPPCASSAISGLLARLQCLGNSSPISGLPFPFLCFVLVFTFLLPSSLCCLCLLCSMPLLVYCLLEWSNWEGRMYSATAQQRYVYATKFYYHRIFRICLWRRLATRLIRLGVVRG